jgi:AraC family transcriptional activator of pyochelin receptor
MDDPPTLKELASQVEISLNNLKEGFKQVYGNTVFGFLFDYKMNIASHLLSSKNYNVNEVAHHLGYSTASHFITAFKSKFGTTPKRYLNSN